MLLTRDCSVSSAHSCSVQFHFRLQHRQLQLSVQAGTVREKRERAGMMFMTGRASTTLTAQCTLHIHNAQCKVHCTGRWLAET